MQNFRYNVCQWYEKNKRSLPWRNSSDPYKVWLSEVILQQTRMDQGLPYYNRFIEAYPTIFDLADATEQEVLKLWQGLGYYSRARNLLHTAKVVVDQYEGKLPDNYKELKTLKGIGDYTAAAISSICFDEPKAVVDGNVYRVLSRFLGLDVPINSTEGKKVFKEKAQLYLDKKDPGTYNQALMEFGALFCKPQNPFCESCVLNAECVAFNQGKVKELPVKIKRTRIKRRYFNYLVFLSDDNQTLLQQRKEADIWKKLYEFPLIESEKSLQKSQLLKQDKLKSLKINPSSIKLFNKKLIKHQLTHQTLFVKFWIIKDFPSNLSVCKSLKVRYEQLKNFPVPVVIDNFLKAFELKI